MNGHFWPLLLSVLASSGLWEFIKWAVSSHKKKLTGEERLLLGMAHDRIWYLGTLYISRGGITKSEFDNLGRVAEPYLAMGGNGTGEKIWDGVKGLPFIAEAEAEKRDAAKRVKIIEEGESLIK